MLNALSSSIDTLAPSASTPDVSPRFESVSQTTLLKTLQKPVRQPRIRLSPRTRKVGTPPVFHPTPTFYPLQTIALNDRLCHLILHPDGETLITVDATNPQIIERWSWQTGAVQSSLSGHAAAISAIALSQDGTTLASGSTDGVIQVWDLASGTIRQTLTGHRNAVASLAISADAATVVSSGCNTYVPGTAQLVRDDRVIRIWDVASGKLRCPTIPSLTDAPALFIDSSMKMLLNGLEMRDLATGAMTHLLDWITGELQAVRSDGQAIVLNTGTHFALHQLHTGEMKCRMPRNCHDRAVHVSALSLDGDFFVAGFHRNDIHPVTHHYLPAQPVLRIWDARTGKALGRLGDGEFPNGLWQRLTFSADSSLLIGQIGQHLQIWARS